VLLSQTVPSMYMCKQSINYRGIKYPVDFDKYTIRTPSNHNRCASLLVRYVGGKCTSYITFYFCLGIPRPLSNYTSPHIPIGGETLRGGSKNSDSIQNKTQTRQNYEKIYKLFQRLHLPYGGNRRLTHITKKSIKLFQKLCPKPVFKASIMM